MRQVEVVSILLATLEALVVLNLATGNKARHRSHIDVWLQIAIAQWYVVDYRHTDVEVCSLEVVDTLAHLVHIAQILSTATVEKTYLGTYTKVWGSVYSAESNISAELPISLS